MHRERRGVPWLVPAVVVALLLAGRVEMAWGQSPTDLEEMAWGQPPADAPEPVGVASGALGAGMFDAQAAVSLDLGIDLAGRHYTMGLGARVRLLFSDGLRTEDWDERSEWATLVRYLSYRRAHDRVQVDLAIGELGGATLGHGVLFDGYSSGLDVDHRHLGAQLRVSDVTIAGEDFTGEGVIDDLLAPRLFGVRGYWQRGGDTRRLQVGLSSALDVSAPVADGVETAEEVLPTVALEGQLEWSQFDQELAGAVYGDAVAIAAMAVGLHLGLRGRARVRERATIGVRGELRLGSGSYIPGWMGPLYEINRRVQGLGPSAPMSARASQLDVARAGGLGGLGGLAEVQVSVDDVGSATVYYARRAGLPDQLVARVAVPYFRAVQGAAWLATEVGAGAETWVLASEVRARINARFFASAEFAHLYGERADELTAVWSAMATFGATLDL